MEHIRQYLPRLDGSALKWVAMGTMLIDHIGAFCLEPWISAAPRPSSWGALYLLMRAIGRIAFPIFCFLLVEGFVHTHDRKRYLVRLTAFALISEIPFDLANFDRPFSLDGQNVFMTLALGLATLMLLDRWGGKTLPRALVLVGGCAAAVFLRTDYDMLGVLMIVIFALERERPRRRAVLGGVILAYETWSLYFAGLLALPLIGCYSGERGIQRRPILFYCFYPAHLVLLALVRWFVLGL